MSNFEFFNINAIRKFLNSREGETKYGEQLNFVSSFEELENHPAKYVIFGIPEDVGIRGNYGKPGAAKTWDSFLSSFLNIQANQFNPPDQCLVLGHVQCEGFMLEAKKIIAKEKNPEKELGPIVEKIDLEVQKVVHQIIAAHKIAIIIGGGHNNSFGNIKGTSEALGRPVNILNIDAHTDLRRTDYRHSGNGFSFAKEKGFINKYAMYGIHRNYTPQYIFDQFKKDEKTKIWFFEDLLNQSPTGEISLFQDAIAFLENSFGIEIDCDAIENFSSSAQTPSGFSTNQIRRFIFSMKKENIYYLHLTEAAAKNKPQIGKSLSYFVSDFISVHT